MSWDRCTRSNPCPICGRTSWCGVSSDGHVVRCMRVSSEHESIGSDGSVGWLHFDDSKKSTESREDCDRTPKVDAEKLASDFYFDPHAARKRYLMARELGVSVLAMELMNVGVGWDGLGREFASFPSFDAKGRVIGITRRYVDGAKMTLRGTSNSGVFRRRDWIRDKLLYVVEGPSDTAVLIDLGLTVIGRPSNSGGAKVIGPMVAKQKILKVVVVGENDRKPWKVGTHAMCPVNCPGCQWCWPGKFGAEHVASQLKRILNGGKAVEIMMPPEKYKDMRHWVSCVGNPFF